MRKFIFTVLLLFVFTGLSSASVHDRAGTSGAAFLNIGVGARPLGMAGAYTALGDDINTLFWNPAGLSLTRDKEIGLMYSRWLETVDYGMLAYKFPETGWGGHVGAGLIYLDMGTIESTLEDEQGLYGGRDGTFSGSDLALITGYSQKLTDEFTLGANVKFIQQTNVDDIGRTVAFDVGGLYSRPESNVTLAATIMNAGFPIKVREESFQLPLKITGGVGYREPEEFNIGLDISKNIDDFLTVSLGGEYKTGEILTLRGGYEYGNKISEMGFISGARIGFSVLWEGLKFDYSLAPHGDLGLTHKAGLILYDLF